MDPLQQLLMGLAGQVPEAPGVPVPTQRPAGPAPAPPTPEPTMASRLTLTPPPGINNPLGAALLFGRQMFGTPPAKPPAIGDQLTSETDVPSSAGPPPVGQTLASSSAPRSSDRGTGGAATPLAPTTAGAPAPSQVRPSSPGSLSDTDLQKFMLQMGLSMMVPKWGGPLSNIAQAVGEGAEAVGRGRTAKREGELADRKLDLEQARINKVGRGSSSSASKLKAKTPMQELSQNMTPEAALYFQQRLKNLKGELEVTDADGNVTTLSESEQFNRLMAETRAIDARTRAAAGRAKSAEINDAALSRYVGTPREAEVLNFVANDPIERALLVQRMETMKRAKAATDANANAAGKR